MFIGTMCTVCLIASLAFVLAGFAAAARQHKKEFSMKGDALYKKHTILTPFQSFLICYYFGVALLFLPIYFYEYFTSGIMFTRVLKTVSLSMHNAFRVFILDGDFNDFIGVISDTERVSRTLGEIYTGYGAILFIASPVMTAGFVLSFFKNISALLRYTFKRADEICYISELSEVSIALATNILTEQREERESEKKKRSRKKPMVVFFDVFEKNEEADTETIDRAKRLGCICFSKDITEIGLKLSRRIKRKFYFIGENSDENIKQAITMINHCREARGGRYNTANTEFYVFSTTTESEALLDSVDNGNMKLRRVNEKRNLIIGTVLKSDVFKNYIIDEEGDKCINTLIIGSGSYGTEFLKTLCWCGQIPGYKVKIHIADKCSDILSPLKNIAPELISRGIIEGEDRTEPDGPYYEIYTHPDVDVTDSTLSELIDSIEQPTAVFVTLGNDELNVETAMKLRGLISRRSRSEEKPQIYTVVYSSIKNITFAQNGGLRSLGKDNYDITFIGDMRERYSLKVIEQRNLERYGLRIHNAWIDRMDEQMRAEKNYSAEKIKQLYRENSECYEKYEYFRRASIATVVHMLVMKKLGIDFGSDIEGLQLAEHKRWCAFMRTEGYVFDKSRKDKIAKTHPDLRPYYELSAECRRKDSIALYDSIADEDERMGDLKC